MQLFELHSLKLSHWTFFFSLSLFYYSRLLPMTDQSADKQIGIESDGHNDADSVGNFSQTLQQPVRRTQHKTSMQRSAVGHRTMNGVLVISIKTEPLTNYSDYHMFHMPATATYEKQITSTFWG